MEANQPCISILIKALNEEGRIARCLEAALREAAQVQAEVILVDSLSTDRTVAIARQYPVRIVQFEHLKDRGCGAAVQLGYQFSASPYVYVLDADMELQPGIMRKALLALQADPGLAGVGGRLLDRQVLTHSDRRRAHAAACQACDADVQELGGGGLYRRTAIEHVGYLSHRSLTAYEEAELAIRLRAAGWRLRRLRMPGVLHEGHVEGNWAMMRRLWRNGRARATATFLRSSIGRPWWRLAVRKQAHVLAVPVLHGLAVIAAVTAPAGRTMLIWGVAWLAILAAVSIKKRSLAAGAWALIFWHYFAAATLMGWAGAIIDPRMPIAGRELTTQPAPSSQHTH